MCERPNENLPEESTKKKTNKNKCVGVMKMTNTRNKLSLRTLSKTKQNNAREGEESERDERPKINAIGRRMNACHQQSSKKLR